MNNSVLFDSFAQKSSQFAVERLVFGKSGKLEIRTIEMIDADIYQIKNIVDDLGYHNFHEDNVPVVRYGTQKVIRMDFSDCLGETAAALGETLFIVTDDDVVGVQQNVITGTTQYMSYFAEPGKAVAMPLQGRRFGGRCGYGGQIITANSVKDQTMTLLENSDPKKLLDNQDSVDYGALKMHLGEVMPMEKAAKVALRLGNWMLKLTCTNVKFGKLAIYFGEFADGDIDGHCYLSGTENIQSRAFTAKAVMEGITHSDMNHKIAWCDSNPIECDADSLDKDNLMTICKAIDRKGKGTAYENRVLIINYDTGVENSPTAFVDMNTLKLGFDVSRQSGMNALHEFGKTLVKPYIHLTGQSVIKAILQDAKGTFDFVRKTHLEQAIDLFMLTSDHLPGSEMMSNPGTAASAASMLDDDFEEKYGFRVPNLLCRKIASDDEMRNEFRVKIPGFQKVIYPDPAAFYGKHIIRPNEYYVFGENEDLTVFKFPTQFEKEYANLVPVTTQKLLERISTIDLPKEIRNDLKLELERLPKDVIYFGSWELFKRMLAGHDYDGDKAMAALRRALEGLLSERGIAIIIETPESKKDPHTVKIDADIMAKIAVEIWRFGNITIGSVTNLFVAFQKMYLDRNFKRFREFAAVVFGNYGHGNMNYNTILKVEGIGSAYPFIRVSQERVDDIFRQIKTMKLDEENILRCLKDINNGVGRFFQERTIDAGKKFNKIVLPADVRKMIRFADSLKNKTELTVDGKTGDVQIKGKGNKKNDGTLEKLSYVMSQDSAAIISQKLQKAMENPEVLPEAQRVYCDQCWRSLDEDMQKAVMSIITIMYNVKNKYAQLCKTGHKELANKFYQNSGELVTNELRKVLSLKNIIQVSMFNHEYASYADDPIGRQAYLDRLYEALPEFRIGVLFGGYFAGKTKGILNQIGGVIMPQEFLAFVAKFSAKDGAVEAVKNANLDFDPDYSVSVMQIQLANEVKVGKNSIKKEHNKNTDKLVKMYNRIKRVHDQGFIFGATPGSDKSMLAMGNGKPVSGMYVNFGFSNLLKEQYDVNGTVSNIQKGDNGYGTYVIIALRNVTENVYKDAGSAADASQEAKA